MLGHPDDLPAAIVYCVVAGPAICQHLSEVALQAVLQDMTHLMPVGMHKAAVELVPNAADA